MARRRHPGASKRAVPRPGLETMAIDRKETRMRAIIRVGVLFGTCLSLSLAALAATGAKDVEATPQAKVYRAALKAIAAGDFEAYKKTLSSATLKQMEEQTKGKSSKEVMEL